MATHSLRYLQATSKNLYTFLYFILVVFLPLFVNYIVLNFKVDTFIATTLVQAETIKLYGHIYSDPLNVEASLPNWYWQAHTLGYIKNGLIIPGIATYIISVVTNLNITASVYLPIPYIISLILLYLIVRRICSDLQISDIFTFIILLLSASAFVANYVLGRFYTMEYHSYSIPFFLLMLYIFTNFWFDHIHGQYNLARSTIIILLTSMALAGTHYNLIYQALGGLITVILITILYTVIKGIQNRNSFIAHVKIYLLFALIILLAVFLQNFYASFVVKIDINKIIKNLITYFITFYKNPIYIKEELVPYIVINPLYSLASKIFTYTSLTYILLFTFRTLSPRYSSRETLGTVEIFWFILGGSFVTWLAYFTAYGYGNFGLEQTWLVTATILTSSLAITRKNIHILFIIKQSFIKIIAISLTILVISSAFVSLYFRVEQASSYDALTPPPGVELVGKFITMNSGGRIIISGAHSTTSRMYIDIAASSLGLLQDVIVGNLPYTIDAFKLCQMLPSNYDIIIISVADLTKGMFGDVSPSYLCLLYTSPSPRD